MDESTVPSKQTVSRQEDGTIAYGHLSNGHQSLAFPEQYKKYVDFVVLIAGILVALLGFFSAVAYLNAWPQPTLLPKGILYWVSYPISWALTFLGVAVILTLPSKLYDPSKGQESKWLTAARTLCLIIPAVTGLYYLVQYLTSSYKEIGEIFLSINSKVPAAFFSALYTFLISLVLLGFRHFHQRQWYSTYVVGIFALFLVALCVFVFFGNIFHLPIMFNFKMFLFSAVAFILLGVAMLAGTLPYEGILLPLFFSNRRVRVMAYIGIIAGLIVLTENISSIGEINRQIGLIHLATPHTFSLYAVLEMSSTIACVVVIILTVRALTYYNESIVYAAGQKSLARKEKTIRQVIQVVHNSLNLEEIFQGICNELGEQLQVDRCFIAQFISSKLTPPQREYRRDEMVPSMLDLNIELWHGLSHLSSLLCLMESPLAFDSEQVISDFGVQMSDIRQLMHEIHLTSGLGCAVYYRGECKAMLFLHQTSGKRIWSNEEKDIVQSVAMQVGVAIYQSDLYRQLQESEQRFRLLIEGAKEYAIYMLDPQGRVCTWNNGVERLSGYTADEVMGQHFSMFLKDTEVPAWYCDHVLDVAGKIGFFLEEGIRHHKDGTAYWLSFTTCALHDESGTLVGYSRILQDITERKRAEQELNDAKHSAELANIRKTKTLTAMSHEFKTSLNAIIGYADMLTQGKANSPEREERYTKSIADSGRHLLTIVNDILDIGQAESGKIRLHPQWIDPGQLLLDLEPMIRPLADELKLQLNFVLDPNTPQVLWDPARMKQAFLNLLSNAVKYNRLNGMVTIRLICSDKQDELIIQVQDTGYGIPSDKLEDIFTEFFRLNGDAQIQTGTGLGLALTRQFVELHGGTVTAESLEGVGSTFTVRVPVKGIVVPLESEASSHIGSA